MKNESKAGESPFRSIEQRNSPLDNLGCDNTLLRIEVGGGLINQVNVSWLAKAEADGYTLKLTTRQMGDLLVKELVQKQWLRHISLELRMDIGSTDLSEEKIFDSALEAGTDLLWLVADHELRNVNILLIRFPQPSEHCDESGLASSILSQHDNDLGVCERSWLHVKLK